MQVSNVIALRDLPFEDYLAMEGQSFSGFKTTKIVPTEKMNIGTLVHAALLTPKEYNHKERDIVLPIVAELKEKLGVMYNLIEKELSVTADFTHEGFLLKYKGRVDMCIRGSLVIDLKVINGNSINDTLQYFNYTEQINGYCYAVGAKLGMIIAYSRKTKKIETILINPNPQWWDNKILVYGKPI